MRTGQYDVAAVQPVEGNELVTCAVHNSRRLSKFCLPKAVYNADRVVVDYIYECRNDSRCAGVTSRDFLRQHRGASGIEISNNMSPRQPAALEALAQATVADTAALSEADAVLQQQKTGAGRGPNRYYDLANQRGPGVAGVKKICWGCGMGGHEKPDCPNALCKTCHNLRGHRHQCQEPRPSPFLDVAPTILFSEDMSSVRCVSCSLFGHFDCSTVRDVTLPSCCFCGEIGHNAYDCHRRKKEVPDRWVVRVSDGANNSLSRGNRSTSGMMPSNSFQGVRDTYSGHGSQSGRKNDAFSSDFRPTNMKGNGGHRKDGNAGGYHGTNSRSSYMDSKPYSANYENNRVSPYGTDASRYSHCGEKRSRWSDDERSHRHHRQTSNHRHVSEWATERGYRSGKSNNDAAGDWGAPRTQRPSHQNAHYKRGRRGHRGKDDSDDDYDLY